MRVVILGCGRVGAGLARLLVRQGHQVTVVDKDPDSFYRLGDDFQGNMVRGLGIDADVLEEAGIRDADAFLAVTSGDNSNVMAAQMAKELYNVPRVLCRVYDPVRAHAYQEMGIQTICPTTLGIEVFRRYLFGEDMAEVEACFRIHGVEDAESV
jgi:trk system potassium uptake protein TrkA